MKFYLLALAGVMAMAGANAVEVASLYTAQVPIDQQQDDPRGAAYEQALREVLLRISGSQVIENPELFETLFPNPAAWVVQFRPGPDNTLFVSFDGNAIETVLRNSGQTVWGGDRPLTLVWVAVDWGGGQREILAAEDDERAALRSINRNRMLRQRILEFAERRGLPVAFPLLDSEDLAQVAFSDVWGGFDERVLQASERYEANSVLIGRVDAARGARGRWTYHFGREQRVWQGEPEVALGRVADLLAAEFSIGGDEPLRRVLLHVSGITSVAAYGDLHALLGDVALIDAFQIVEVAGDRVSIEVAVHGGAPRLARALRFEGLIEEERIDSGSVTADGFLPELSFYFES